MTEIDAETIARLPFEAMESVAFFKLDQLTTDLICCEISCGGEIRLFHEEMAGWERLLLHLEQLPGFRADWINEVSQPAFEECRTMAYLRR